MYRPCIVGAFYSHLPFVKADTSVDLQPLGVSITGISFAEWSSLDSGFASLRDAEKRFNATGPVFVVIENAGDLEQAYESARRAHLALLLATGDRVPEPATSVTYVRTGEDGFQYRFGPLEREALLYAPTICRTTIDGEVAPRLAALAGLVAATSNVLEIPEVRFAWRTLCTGALSEISAVEDMALCAVATEELIMGDVRKDLTATFTSRAGALLSPDQQLGQQLGRAVYRLRSGFLHGEGDEPGDLNRHVLAARFLLVRALTTLLYNVSINNLPQDVVAGFRALLDARAGRA